MRGVVAGCMALLVAGTASAERVTLDQLVQTFVAQSPDRQRVAADENGARATAELAQQWQDWTLAGGLNWSSRRRGFVNGNPFQTVAEDTGTFSLGVTRGLSWGGTLGVTAMTGLAHLQFAVLDGTGARYDVEAKSYMASALVRWQQPLLAGRGGAARADSRRANALATKAQLLTRVTTEASLEAVVRGYWELWYAQQQLGIAKASLALAQEEARLTDIAVAKRAAAPADATLVALAVARREQATLVAEAALIDQSLALRRRAGLPATPGELLLSIEETSVPELPTAEGDLQTRLTEAQNNNAVLASARAGVTVGELEAAGERDRGRSRLDLDVSAGPDASGSTANDAWRQAKAGDAYVASAGLTFTHGLLGYARSGGERLAEARRASARIDAAIAERDVFAEVVSAHNQLRIAHARMRTANIAVTLATDALANEKKAYQVGETRLVDVLTRQDGLAQAELDAARAAVDAHLAGVQLLRLAGSLLTTYRVAL